MRNKIRFSNLFNKRMLSLAIITGIIISISMPLTYLILLLDYEKEQAHFHSYQLSRQMQTSVKENPTLWQYNVQKFTEVFSNHEKDGISIINIYDKQNNLIYSNVFSEFNLFDIPSRSAIVYNNEVFGYVEIEERIGYVIYTAMLLLLIFSFAGLVIGMILYRFPTRIVMRAEEEVATAFNKLNYLSYHDMLTDLPNRLRFNDDLTKAIENADKKGRKLGVMFLDLDRFKLINDTLGHNNGDLLLKKVAKRLQDSIRKNDTVARLGGDEFTVILPTINNSTEVAMVAGKILKSLHQPFILEGEEFVITTSIGISIYPSDGEDIDTLIKNADAAMYFAKENGNNKYQFYSPSMNEASAERLSLENSLRKALKRDELLLFYQPIVGAENQDIIGVEALVRWKHPERGILSPKDFLPIAKETGLIAHIDEWVFRTACNQIRDWQRKGLPDIYVSINLSERMFQKRNFVKFITKTFEDTGIKAKYIQLEITECIAMNDEENIVNNLHSLKEIGVRMAIDDFGTGYSSLSRLKIFPIHTLKIDKSFIDNITINSNDLAITTSIINLAYNLGLNVIAEGVENINQLNLLKEHGCNEIQGYYFSEPIPAKEFEKFLKVDQLQIM